MHHHVALDNVGDAERLYRFINGTALGLVACGGGAYCAAHVGLYKALMESGLTFDIMGGTSGGAAMTAAFAMGTHPDDVDRATHDIFVTNRAMRRYTWPRYSLLDHTHYDRQLAKLLRRHRHRGSVDPLLLRLHQPVELRPAPPPPGRPVGRRACHRLDPRAAAALLHQGRPHAGRRRPPGQRADPRDARAEERAQRGDQLRGAEAASASRWTTARCPAGPRC